MKKLLFVFLMTAALPAMAAEYLNDFESVPPSQDYQILGPVGAVGDVLQRLVVNVTTSGTSQVSISDGPSTVGSQYVIVPPSTPVGVYHIEIGARATAAGWRVRTAAGVSVFAVGAFH